jgi:hypothetical protein
LRFVTGGAAPSCLLLTKLSIQVGQEKARLSKVDALFWSIDLSGHTACGAAAVAADTATSAKVDDGCLTEPIDLT